MKLILNDVEIRTAIKEYVNKHISGEDYEITIVTGTTYDTQYEVYPLSAELEVKE